MYLPRAGYRIKRVNSLLQPFLPVVAVKFQSAGKEIKMKQLTNEQVGSVSGGEPRGRDSDGRQNDGSDIREVYRIRDDVYVHYKKSDGSDDGGQRFRG